MIETYNTIKKRQSIKKEVISQVARLALRENIWAKLESKDMYIHFGYDYYMYIGSTKHCNNMISKIEESGLFVEPFVSPYSDEYD